MKKKIVGVIAACLMTFGVAPSAMAHSQEKLQGNDRAVVSEGYSCNPGADGECWQYHRKYVINDRECDGNDALIIVEMRDGTRYNSRDSDCSADSNFSFVFNNGGIARFQVCEMVNHSDTVNTCTAWEDIDPVRHWIVAA